MRKAKVLAILFFLLPFLLANSAWGEDVVVTLPTGGVYRNRMAIPVAISAVTYGNSAKYRINLRTPESSSDVIHESRVVPQRSEFKVVLPVMLNSLNPGLQVSATNILSELRKKLLTKDFSNELYGLSENERFFLFTGCFENEQSSNLLTIPNANAKIFRTTVDSGAFDRWQFLESVDCVVVFANDLNSWSKERLLALRCYIEMGGIVVSVSRNGSSVALQMFPKLDITSVKADFPKGVSATSGVSFKHKVSCFDFGLGKLVCFEDDLKGNAVFWAEIFANIDFKIAPISLFQPLATERGFSASTDKFFSVMEISPHYRKTILIIIAIVFFSFLLVAALLYSFKLAKRLIISVLVISVLSIGISMGIHSLVPGSGTVWRYRNIVEKGSSDFGRVTIFCSIAATSEMASALVQPDYSQVKLIEGWKQPVLMQKHGEKAVVRGLYVGISRSLVLSMQFPLSSVNFSGFSVLNQNINASSGEFLTSMDEILLTRYLCKKNGGYTYCGRKYDSEEFFDLAEKGEFLTGEIEFVQEFFSHYRGQLDFANLFIPPNESGEILSNEVTWLNFSNAESYGASLLLHRNPPKDVE